MCLAVKGPDRPHICSVHCDTDEECGEGAMCGLNRGWIRTCVPKRCEEFRFAPERVAPVAGVPAAHAGAMVCDPGVAFSDEGWGARCATNADCSGKAHVCSRFIYPPGVPVCERECECRTGRRLRRQRVLLDPPVGGRGPRRLVRSAGRPPPRLILPTSQLTERASASPVA